MSPKVINHWGIWIDSSVPVTGVVTNNHVSQFISDEMYNGIDLAYENHLNSDEHIDSDDEDCPICEYWDYSNDYLIGDWIKDNDGLYTYDPEGEYAAIVGEIYTQVVFSKHTKKCNVCSPCYPGQCDLDSEGDFLAYDLPPEAYQH